MNSIFIAQYVSIFSLNAVMQLAAVGTAYLGYIISRLYVFISVDFDKKKIIIYRNKKVSFLSILFVISAHGGGNLLPPQIALVEFKLFLKFCLQFCYCY